MSIGVVIIGRNEGERLRRCLASVSGAAPVVYVDSGSTDASVSDARAAGARVVELDMGVPFTAARARNAGADALLRAHPGLRYVQFVDGDSELEPAWLDHAVALMDSTPQLAALSGRIREKFPHASIYNRLADREWDVATGQTESCAGICAMRVEAFRQAGGFDPGVAAGEEPEICLRIRKHGHTVMRIEFPMAQHDIAIGHFGQWWRRQERGGFGGTDVARRFGHPAFRRQIRSARVWGLGWPAAVGVAGALAVASTGLASLLLLAAVLLAWPAQAARLGLRARRRGLAFRDAMIHGLLTMIAKWAHLRGQFRWSRANRSQPGGRPSGHSGAAPALPRASLGQ